MAGKARTKDVPGPKEPRALKRILVAIDGSESSMRALAMAAAMAVQFVAELVAISVASLPEYTFMDYGGVSPAVTEAMRRAAEDHARAVLDRAREVARQHGVEAETTMDFGPVKETLLYAVSRYHPDMLVVGSRGLSRIKKLLLGSVSEAMVRYAGCPVLVMK